MSACSMCGVNEEQIIGLHEHEPSCNLYVSPSNDANLRCLGCGADALQFELLVHGPGICGLGCMACNTSVTLLDGRNEWIVNGNVAVFEAESSKE